MGALADRHRHVEGGREVGQIPVLAASWIEPVESAEAAARNVRRPAYTWSAPPPSMWLRRRRRSASAAHGLYELFVRRMSCRRRGAPPGVQVGLSASRSRATTSRPSCALVTDRAVGVLLSNGWWRGQNAGAALDQLVLDPRSGRWPSSPSTGELSWRRTAPGDPR